VNCEEAVAARDPRINILETNRRIATDDKMDCASEDCEMNDVVR